MSVALHLLEPSNVEAEARRAAGWLAARGVRAGDRVAVVAANDPRLLAVTHGALRTGVIPVVVSPDQPPGERARQLADCEPALVIEDLAAVPLDGGAQAELAPFPLGRPMLYTSGTTGWPKGVWSGVLDEARARAYAEDEAELWCPDPDAVSIVVSPLHHSAPHRSATAALLAGARVLLFERFDAAALARALSEHRVSSTFFVPTHLRRLFALGDLPRPRDAGRVLHAGEACPEPLKRRALGWFPEGTLWEFYGSTEGQFTAISPAEWLEHPGSVGRARRGRSLDIVEPNADGIGTVFVSAPPFARWEYWRSPEQTARGWRGDSFTVGDVGRLDADGYLYLAARREDLIISGGVNVYPAMVERILMEHPSVTEAAVFGVDDDEWGQRVCAAVVCDDELAARAWCDERLDGAHRPKDLRVVDVLPRTATGKLDRNALRGGLGR